MKEERISQKGFTVLDATMLVGLVAVFLAVAIYRPHALVRQMEELDAMIDDGDLLTGSFQRWGEKYHYILQE